MGRPRLELGFVIRGGVRGAGDAAVQGGGGRKDVGHDELGGRRTKEQASR